MKLNRHGKLTADIVAELERKMYATPVEDKRPKRKYERSE